MIIESNRLMLRELTLADFDDLFLVLSDSDITEHYPYNFDETRVRNWILKNIERYKEYGFGLWAVTLKSSKKLIGDCGLTIQNINGKMLPEIGYHIKKDFWRQGFGSEAAKAVRDWAFQSTQFNTIYSYMKYSNIASYSTAKSMGMKKVNEYPDKNNGFTFVYAITREEWNSLNVNLSHR